MTVPYFTKVLGGRTLTDAEAWSRATPQQRQEWWPAGPPAGVKGGFSQYGYETGPASVDQVTGASLAEAMSAGRRALEAGYGGVLPDGQAPCGTCPSCTHGRPQNCRRPTSKAMARLRADQAEGDRLDQAWAAAVANQHVIWSEENRRQLAF
jgi:hypothetical protein